MQDYGTLYNVKSIFQKYSLLGVRSSVTVPNGNGRRNQTVPAGAHESRRANILLAKMSLLGVSFSLTQATSVLQSSSCSSFLVASLVSSPSKGMYSVSVVAARKVLLVILPKATSAVLLSLSIVERDPLSDTELALSLGSAHANEEANSSIMAATKNIEPGPKFRPALVSR